MCLIDVGVVAIVGLFYNSFLAMSFDEEFARAMGIPVRLLYYVLLAMIALSVIMLIRVVGLILVIALLTIPPFIAEKFCRSLKAMMVVAVVLNCIFSLVGLWLSYAYNLTSGAAIIMVAAAFFFASILIERAANLQLIKKA
jgi:zinc transport system permease protein